MNNEEIARLSLEGNIVLRFSDRDSFISFANEVFDMFPETKRYWTSMIDSVSIRRNGFRVSRETGLKRGSFEFYEKENYEILDYDFLRQPEELLEESEFPLTMLI